MLFGLTNTPAIFQGYINKILVEKHEVFMIIYLKDISIYIESETEKHIKAVW